MNRESAASGSLVFTSQRTSAQTSTQTTTTPLSHQVAEKLGNVTQDPTGLQHRPKPKHPDWELHWPPRQVLQGGHVDSTEHQWMWLRFIQEIYNTNCVTKAWRIIKDCRDHNHRPFQLLPSGKQHQGPDQQLLTMNTTESLILTVSMHLHPHLTRHLNCQQQLSLQLWVRPLGTGGNAFAFRWCSVQTFNYKLYETALRCILVT